MGKMFGMGWHGSMERGKKVVWYAGAALQEAQKMSVFCCLSFAALFFLIDIDIRHSLKRKHGRSPFFIVMVLQLFIQLVFRSCTDSLKSEFFFNERSYFRR